MADTTTGRTAVAGLHRSGLLVARYPDLRTLLADASDDELTAAGHLLSRLRPDDVLAAHPATPTVSVAVTGHGTLAPLVAPLTAQLARHGLLGRISVGDFDSYVADLAEPGSALYASDPDLVLCVLDPTVVFDEVPVPWRPEDVDRALTEKLSLLSGLASRFRAAGRGTLVLNTLPLTRRFTAQLVDQTSRSRLSALWHAANAALLRMAEEHPAVVVLDLDPLLAEGIAAEDARLDTYAKAHLSPALLARYAREVGQLARQATGLTKKVLALDLDETVWGGVLGEDGPEGIEAAGTHRGEAFRAFQRVVKQLGSQGVLLAAVSKNDAEAVTAVFREHPDMVLREEDFVRIVANWRPKHDNLTELAAALNLGVDSFVFVDDSPFECGLVRRELPGVAVVPVDAEPAHHVGRLLHDGWFDTPALTAEDRTRVVKYRDELVRKDFLDSFASLDDYLRQLGVVVRLAPVGPEQVGRVSQLTLRTSQFNLTTERLQPARVRELADAPDALVLTVHSRDRFGDNGLVGAVFAHRTGRELHLDNFLLSCRVFSRGIEQACLAAVLRHARETGVARVFGSYRASARNGKVRDFYPRNGFTEVSGDESATTFRHDLTHLPEPPAHIDLTDLLGERP
ncbi:HAD-IIIC family phosphatase [Streptomyces cyanogenus]|uniref:Uncharacterized protein n=1 Tax=Streptomyces cyanogenus TaxID=80860 RepID=A0ABX7TMX6_STRCY|nr:HAD-IIIC family phosphatase [Streptomyces cyanogenus]QTD96705.1 hypothetical protein S1361_05045 [Streptomyces cyanogenus]